MKTNILATFIVLLLILSSVVGYTHASPDSSVGATIKLSICGNDIKEPGEECDGADIPRSCDNLGFAGGSLSCGIACVFDITSCTTPSLDPTNITPNNIDSLLAAGYLSVPSNEDITSTSIITTSQEITINVPVAGGSTNVTLPQDLTINTSDSSLIDPTTDLTISSVSTESVSGILGAATRAALQWGVEGTTLEFNSPITISIYVGSSEGETLNVVRSTSLTEGWTNDGIVAPATCLTSNGLCTFQAIKASYYAVTKTISTPNPTPTPTPTSSNSSIPSSGSSESISSGGGSSLVTTLLQTILNNNSLPAPLLRLDMNGDGKIEPNEIAIVAGGWVKSWSDFINGGSEVKNCDLNSDGDCDLSDFSILLYYIGR